MFHLYKCISSFGGVRLLNSSALQVIHRNDYPARPPRAEVTGAQRIYSGDRVAPLGELIRALRRLDIRGALSLAYFNRDFWRQDALPVACAGLEKMRAVVRQSRHG